MVDNSRINDILVKLINDIWVMEKRALATGEFEELTANDFHVIEAIGLGKGDNMAPYIVGLFVAYTTGNVVQKATAKEANDEGATDER